MLHPRPRPARRAAGRIALALTAALVAVAGCSDDSGSEAATTGAPSTAGTTTEPGSTDAPTTTAPVPAPVTQVILSVMSRMARSVLPELNPVFGR